MVVKHCMRSGWWLFAETGATTCDSKETGELGKRDELAALGVRCNWTLILEMRKDVEMIGTFKQKLIANSHFAWSCSLTANTAIHHSFTGESLAREISLFRCLLCCFSLPQNSQNRLLHPANLILLHSRSIRTLQNTINQSILQSLLRTHKVIPIQILRNLLRRLTRKHGIHLDKIIPNTHNLSCLHFNILSLSLSSAHGLMDHDA